MKLNKKAQGLSLRIIIIAAILLIVMVVLLFIFFGGMRDVKEGLANCEAKGGYCNVDSDCSQGGIPTPTNYEDDSCNYCCIQLS